MILQPQSHIVTHHQSQSHNVINVTTITQSYVIIKRDRRF